MDRNEGIVMYIVILCLCLGDVPARSVFVSEADTIGPVMSAFDGLQRACSTNISLWYMGLQD
jgi:hypothetical protein